MPVEQIVGKLNQPKMASDSFRLAAALEKLGDDHFRIVDGNDGNAAVTERGNGVFGINNRDIWIHLVQQLGQRIALGFGQFGQGTDGLERGPATNSAAGFGIIE